MEYLGVEKYILKFWCAIDKERIDFKTVDWPSIEERFIVFILESDLRAIAYLIIYLGAINNWRLPLRGGGGNRQKVMLLHKPI